MQVKIGGTFSPMLEKCSCRYTVNNVPQRKRKWEWKWENLAFAWADFFRWEGHNSWREWGDCWRWDWKGKGGASYIALLNYQAPKNVGAAKGTAIVCLLCFICSLRSFSVWLPWRLVRLSSLPKVLPRLCRNLSSFISVCEWGLLGLKTSQHFSTHFDLIISQNSLFGLPLPPNVCLSLKNVS